MSDLNLRCPEKACTGWVCWIDDGDEKFWGCGECGNVWPTREELDAAITGAVEKHPYRAKCYLKSTKSGGVWDPVPLDDEPEDYEELVDEEWEEDEDEEEDDEEDEDESSGESAGRREYPYGVDENSYRCPVSQCDGWVSWCDDVNPPGWECGWCASVWHDKANLLKEIEAIVRKYPYRQSCYVLVEGQWKPAGIEKEPADYEKLVEKEPADDCEDHPRG